MMCAQQLLARLSGETLGCLQNNVTTLLNGLRASVAVPAELEEAMRMVPRPAFLPLDKVRVTTSYHTKSQPPCLCVCTLFMMHMPLSG